MTITKLQRTVVDALEDIKAQDIRVFNTTGLSDLFDRVVLASATSNRQTRSLANHLKEKAKEKGFPVVSTEGEESGEWVLVDLGDMIVHIMQPAIREYYNLEELWGAKPVKVKLGGAAAEQQVAAAPAARAPVTESTRASPARKPAARKPSPDKPAVPRKQAAGTKAAGTKTAGTKAAGTKTAAPAKKPAAPGRRKTANTGGAGARPTLASLRRARAGGS
jgi:ribosome-associated protein